MSNYAEAESYQGGKQFSEVEQLKIRLRDSELECEDLKEQIKILSEEKQMLLISIKNVMSILSDAQYS